MVQSLYYLRCRRCICPATCSPNSLSSPWSFHQTRAMDSCRCDRCAHSYRPISCRVVVSVSVPAIHIRVLACSRSCCGAQSLPQIPALPCVAWSICCQGGSEGSFASLQRQENFIVCVPREDGGTFGSAEARKRTTPW